MQQVLRILSAALNPPRAMRALRRRAEQRRQSRRSLHVAAARQQHERGKLVIADLDWYGFSNFDFAKVFEAVPGLGERFHLQKVPRSAVFSLARDTGRGRRTWEEDGQHVGASYRGYNLWALCAVSFIKELGYFPGETLTAEERTRLDQYYRWAVACIDGVERLLDEMRPYAVVVFQGGIFDSRCVVECALRRGIRPIAVETSFIGDHALVDSLSGIIVNRHSLAARGSTMYDVRRPDPAFDPLAFWQQSLARKGDHHRTGGQSVESLNLPAGKRYVLVIGQVAVDASIVLDSPVYRSPAELVEHVTRIAREHPDWHVVARLHPKEAWRQDLRNTEWGPGEYLWDNTLVELQRRGLDREPNLTIISGPGISTYELMRLCEVGVLINSQAGLEMTLLGKPVVTTGRCFYAGNGFTWDVGRKDLLGPAIESAMRAGLAAEETARLHEFCRYLFSHYMLPLDPARLPAHEARLREVLGVSA